MSVTFLQRDHVSQDFELCPNLLEHALSSCVGCALQENIETAQNAFHRCCPSMFEVVAVYGQKSENKPLCRWIVQYGLANNSNFFEGGVVFEAYLKLIGRYSPCDTKVIDCTLSDVVTVSFGVLCKCTPSFFDAVTQIPKHQLLDMDEDVLRKKLWCMNIRDENS